MRIQQKDIYHGAALTQIVEHESFKALNKLDEKYGHYKINHDIRLMIKITSSDTEPWKFTANANDLGIIKDDINSGDQFFMCLICGQSTICLLDGNQVQQLLDLSNNKQQWIRIRNTGSLWASSKKKDLKNAIPHKAFPLKIFQAT